MEIADSEGIYIFYSDVCCLIAHHKDCILPLAKYESGYGMLPSFWIFHNLRFENNFSVHFQYVNLTVNEAEHFFIHRRAADISLCVTMFL